MLNSMAAALLLFYAGNASAVYVKPQGAAINVVNEDGSPFAGQTLTITSVDDPAMSYQVRTDDDGRLCFVTDENDQTRTDDDEDTFSCIYLPDGRYQTSGGLNARFTVTGGVPRFSVVSQLSKVGKIGAGAAIVGLAIGLSDGDNNGSGSGTTTDDGDATSDPAPQPATPAASVKPPQLDPNSAVFIHKVSVSPCPQTITTVNVRNTSNVAVNMTVAGVPGQVTVVGANQTIPPGATRMVTLKFNCASAQSFQATLQFRASAQGQAAQSNFNLTGNVQ
ncbi:MAG: hypothetical protein DWQ08_05535 [Proteobacteria bacterium]|nr:MAG: hypothetical protein DWQ08_05535 [Pseudomonadota bacterium]